MKSFIKYIMTCVKGICMGAADVVPGVSGGTIAFMTGIYEELIASINSIDTEAVKLIFKGKFKAFWKHINGNFLLSVATGILISVFSLAKLMQFLLSDYPIRTWAFFFGLIVASSIFILKGVKNWRIKDVIITLIGVVLGVTVCTLSPTQTPDSLWFVFICGAIAICAMILPGISGSFILLILGKYDFMMNAIASMDWLVLIIFALGAATGILAFAKFLNWLLSKYHRATLLTLAGFIIGSLVKVWPWGNISADTIDLHIPGAILFALIGFALVTSIEVIGNKMASKK